MPIPVVVIGGGALVLLIDPEWAHGTADYPRNFRLLQFVQMGAMMGIAALTLVLWAATCYFMLKAKQRSPLWLALAAGGPLGFPFITMLADRAPAALGETDGRFRGDGHRRQPVVGAARVDDASAPRR